MARKPSTPTLVPEDWRNLNTVSVPVAGAIIGLNIDAAYRATQAGTIPTIRFGRKILVPTASAASAAR